MKAKKKNRFLTFCCSLLPGAAEMYMGFMKTGLSLMGLFFLFMILISLVSIGELAAFMVVIWCYGFFHANHLASLSEEEFSQIEDEYLFGKSTLFPGKDFGKKYQKWIAAVLILIGGCFLWDSVAGMLYDLLPDAYRIIPTVMWRIADYIPKLLAGIVIVAIGIRLIIGKKAQLSNDGIMIEERKEQEEKHGEADNQN